MWNLREEGPDPKNPRLTRSPLTTARMVAKRASSENSRSTISNPKNRPVIGALNVAAIAPAAPQATMKSKPCLGHAHQLAESRGERGADLNDRALASDRSACSDADRRRECLDDRHSWTDPPAVLGDSEHHLRHPVTTGLARKALDKGP